MSLFSVSPNSKKSAKIMQHMINKAKSISKVTMTSQTPQAKEYIEEYKEATR
jgi:preprotein translocase subunit Sss1